jgi:4-hydroxybenzoate polyprenyltransferase
LYTVGVLLPSLAVSEQPWPWLIILQFLLVALTNLIVFSWFDYERDTADGSTSFVTVTGKSFSRVFMALLFTTGVVLGLANNSIPSYILLGMDLVMLILFLRPQQFEIRDRFRIAGDSIFFIPALYLWL